MSPECTAGILLADECTVSILLASECFITFLQFLPIIGIKKAASFWKRLV
jgi:hypothetical protein